LDGIEELLAVDIPRLMSQLPQQQFEKDQLQVGNVCACAFMYACTARSRQILSCYGHRGMHLIFSFTFATLIYSLFTPLIWLLSNPVSVINVISMPPPPQDLVDPHAAAGHQQGGGGGAYGGQGRGGGALYGSGGGGSHGGYGGGSIIHGQQQQQQQQGYPSPRGMPSIMGGGADYNHQAPPPAPPAAAAANPFAKPSPPAANPFAKPPPPVVWPPAELKETTDAQFASLGKLKKKGAVEKKGAASVGCWSAGCSPLCLSFPSSLTSRPICV
jgi:hypothetical protein